MALVVVTRTVLHPRWVVRFMWGSLRVALQARSSAGYLGGSLRVSRGAVFWTLTLWQDGAAMNAFRGSAAHGALMPKLAIWARQASTTAWKVDSRPSWDEAHERLLGQARWVEIEKPDGWHLRRELQRPSPWALTVPVPRPNSPRKAIHA